MAKETNHMEIADFLVFGGTLLVSTAAGVYFAWKDRKKKSTDQYYFGGGNLSPIPVAASISVSYFSAVAVIGETAEIYLNGVVYAWFTVAFVLATIFASIYFVPLYHRLRLKTLYEYLELRFNLWVRKLSSLLSLLFLGIYLGTVTYVPSLALTAVTQLRLEWAIALTTIVCTFYTTIGGMKAVVWTDLIQAIILFVGLLAVLIQVVLSVGGFDAVISAVERGGRNNFFKFDPDPRIRSTAWSILFGLGIFWCNDTCCNQVYVQRYLSCRTVNLARIALLLSLVPGILLNMAVVGIGLAIYAYFEGCDPLQSGKITKIDQALPLVVAEVFDNLPGMTGLFVSTIYCGTLSSISSGINSMAAMTLSDFISPCFPKMSSKAAMNTSKLLCLMFGVLVMCLAYMISLLSSNVVQAMSVLSGFTVGPLFGVFAMGVFTPWINSKGAFAGLASGFAISCWIGLSGMFSTNLAPQTSATLPVSTEYCPLEFGNVTGSVEDVSVTTIDFGSETTVFIETDGSVLDRTLYSTSPFFHALVGFIICTVFGHIASFITGFNKPSESDPRLFVPLINSKAFRFGVPEMVGDENDMLEEKKRLNKEALIKDTSFSYA